jgi:hypothetical protein
MADNTSGKTAGHALSRQHIKVRRATPAAQIKGGVGFHLARRSVAGTYQEPERNKFNCHTEPLTVSSIVYVKTCTVVTVISDCPYNSHRLSDL